MHVESLTHEIVRDAAPRAKRYVIWDGSRSGFGQRVSPNSEKDFVVKTSQ